MTGGGLLQVIRANQVLVEVVRDVSLHHLRPAAPLFRLESLRCHGMAWEGMGIGSWGMRGKR